MDAANVILMALANAVATGGQATLNDSAKEVFEHLKKRIIHAFSGRQSALSILDNFEHDPDTWEKPLKDVLIKAGLPQDDVTLKIAQRLIELTNPQASIRDHISVQHFGPGNGSVYGNNYGSIHVASIEDKIADGKTAFIRGREALWRREYDVARRHLEDASRLIPEHDLPAESAQVRYMQALALLNGMRPYSAAFQTLRRIEELLQGAITLHRSHSYLCTLAFIKRDYSHNGFVYLLTQAQELFQQAQIIPPSTQDQENMVLLSHCQPRLMQDMQD
jgi:tetratricopeptide (TPR) repeat protein